MFSKITTPELPRVLRFIYIHRLLYIHPAQSYIHPLPSSSIHPTVSPFARDLRPAGVKKPNDLQQVADLNPADPVLLKDPDCNFQRGVIKNLRKLYKDLVQALAAQARAIAAQDYILHRYGEPPFDVAMTEVENAVCHEVSTTALDRRHDLFRHLNSDFGIPKPKEGLKDGKEIAEALYNKSKKQGIDECWGGPEVMGLLKEMMDGGGPVKIAMTEEDTEAEAKAEKQGTA